MIVRLCLGIVVEFVLVIYSLFELGVGVLEV